jgi:hypothetical protein
MLWAESARDSHPQQPPWQAFPATISFRLDHPRPFGIDAAEQPLRRAKRPPGNTIFEFFNASLAFEKPRTMTKKER